MTVSLSPCMGHCKLWVELPELRPEHQKQASSKRKTEKPQRNGWNKKQWTGLEIQVMPHTVVVKDGRQLPRELGDSPSLEMSNIQPGKARKNVL